ncbi:angiomotin-like protein 1 [Sabethes cyaneus]|uniref:angiomotin-like protein 1 n=1 Tax=Sabethes cyaneus TaxID=53552 RepID=UPI00237D772A|nr:angiomotin-like protein 1 [Sabethes cyaneus]
MSHTHGLRYSQYSSSGAGPQTSSKAVQSASAAGNGNGRPGSTTPQIPPPPAVRPPLLVTSSGCSMMPAPPVPQPQSQGSSQQAQQQQQQSQTAASSSPKYAAISGSLSGSDTDVSTSTENLTREERYVLRHARVEPQGEENMQGNTTPVNEIQSRYIPDKFSSNTSSDSTRYATPTSSRSISESRNAVHAYANSVNEGSNRNSLNGSNSNRNSLKEPNSNRSSMDVSQSSYNTLIIHDEGLYPIHDEGIYSLNREYSSPPPYGKKERPRSYGESQPPMQEIAEIPEEYLSQSHVLKHLAKEVKLPSRNRSDSTTRDSGVSENTDSRDHPPKYGQHWTTSTTTTTMSSGVAADQSASTDDSANSGSAKLKSKSQPDLTRLDDIEPEEVEALFKENRLLKQQLNSCFLKVAKSQKMEQEIANIYRVHEELVQSCERRERLEEAARNRLQQDLRRLQELNRAYRDQVEGLQNQLLSSSDHQLGRTQQDVLISQLVTQNKSLVDANRRQCIELQAQNATLEEQRIHINVLDTALKRLEEECRQKQVYVERCAQLQHALQSLQNASERREQVERKLRMDYENDLPNRSGSSTTSETENLKWQLREKDAQIMRLEAECAKLEQRNLEESNVRNVAKLAMERNSQETERIIAEAKQEKIRYLDEAHAANRKVTELQTRLKLVENRLAEKEAMIRAYQGQKIYGSTNSYGSYNLSSDSFALNPLGAYNSQVSYDVSNNSFDVTTAASLLDPTYGQNPSSSFTSNYGQTNPSFNQSSINLQTAGSNSYSSPSSSSNYSTNYGSSEHTTIYDAKNFDAQRKSIDDQLKQLDEQLLSKRGLCCFPSLTTKKPIQPLLSDEVSVLSTNNSDSFLQNLAHIDQRDRERQDRREQDGGGGGGGGGGGSAVGGSGVGGGASGGSNGGSNGGATKPEDMMLLEKQGRCSQKIRSNQLSNLAHVTHTVGQNMTDISNIGGNKVPKILSNIAQHAGGILPPRKDRGSSLPPSALPRPPRSLKPPRKIEYGRLNDSEGKKRAETPPKSDAQKDYELKTSSLKRANASAYGKREFSPGKSYLEMKDTFQLAKDYGTLKSKNYGSLGNTSMVPMKNDSKFGFGSKSNSSTANSCEFSKPDYTSTKNYQRLEEQSPRKSSLDTATMKRSLLPNVRKLSSATVKGSRESLNSASSGSNNSNNSNPISRSSPIHSMAPTSGANLPTSLVYHHHNHLHHGRTPPRFIHHQQSTSAESTKSSLNPPSPQSPTVNHQQSPFFNKLSPSTQQQQQHKTTTLPSASILHAAVTASATSAIGQQTTASLPPKPVVDGKLTGSGAGSNAGSSSQAARRGSSLTRSENKYRIQF